MSKNKVSKIEHLRRGKEWGQDELSERSSIAQGYISQIETGRVLPSAGVAMSIAKALGVEVSDLFSVEIKFIPTELLYVE